MGSNGEPAGTARGSAERQRENRALYSHARALMESRTVLAFRCECEHPLCREVVALTLAEYDVATVGARAVVAPAHSETDDGVVVERTNRFCVVEEAPVAV